MNELTKEYFDWMCNVVCNKSNKDGPTFKKLMRELMDVEFMPMIIRDDNRASNGMNLRYRFGIECGYPRSYIKDNLFSALGRCSVLEMMIRLSFDIEELVMEDPDYGNRTGQWFWNMIVSLGLGIMDDDNFDTDYVAHVIFRFMNREYSPNGKGGLFTLENPPKDLRDVEIWYQAMWYLDENYDFTV